MTPPEKCVLAANVWRSGDMTGKADSRRDDALVNKGVLQYSPLQHLSYCDANSLAATINEIACATNGLELLSMYQEKACNTVALGCVLNLSP